MALTPAQRIAATALGRGLSRGQAARAAGVAPRTVGYWKAGKNGVDIDAWAETVIEATEATPELGALDVLRAAMTSATLRDGSPDWPTRVRAAGLLVSPAAREAAADQPQDRAAAPALPPIPDDLFD